MLTNEELFLSNDIDTLYKRNKKLMFHIANKFLNLKIEQADLIGCGNLAFTKSIKRFNPSKSKWVTYFSRVMVNEILMLNRSLSKQVETVSLDTVICEDNNCNVLTIQEILQAPADTADEAINMMAMDEIIKFSKKETSRKCEVLKLYINGVKQRDIGEKLNLSQSYISRIIKNIYLELKEAYEKGA